MSMIYEGDLTVWHDHITTQMHIYAYMYTWYNVAIWPKALDSVDTLKWPKQNFMNFPRPCSCHNDFACQTYRPWPLQLGRRRRSRAASLQCPSTRSSLVISLCLEISWYVTSSEIHRMFPNFQFCICLIALLYFTVSTIILWFSLRTACGSIKALLSWRPD